MAVTLVGIIIFDKELQPSNALSSILVTLEGIIISCNDLHVEKVLMPMLDIFEEIADISY